jgi:hypothetical protein
MLYLFMEYRIIIQCEHKRCCLDILQLQNTTSSNQVKLPKKYVRSTLKFYYENLINNKLSKLDKKSQLYLFSNLKQNVSVENSRN